MNAAVKDKLSDNSAGFMMPDYRQVVHKYQYDDQYDAFGWRRGRINLGNGPVGGDDVA